MQRKITNLCCTCPFFLTIYFGANNNLIFVVRSHIISHQLISNFTDRPTSNERAKFSKVVYALKVAVLMGKRCWKLQWKLKMSKRKLRKSQRFGDYGHPHLTFSKRQNTNIIMDKKIGIGIGSSSKWFFGDKFLLLFNPKWGKCWKALFY